jgi:hypothetical protein
MKYCTIALVLLLGLAVSALAFERIVVLEEAYQED